MDLETLKQRAKALAAQAQAEMAQPYFQDTIAWLTYLGLLRHNMIAGRRARVSVRDALRAGELEPRVLELLPALLIGLPDALSCEAGDIPEDLRRVVDAVKRREPAPDFRGIPPQAYLRWLTSNVLALAAQRLNFRSRPRARHGHETTPLGSVISQARRERSLTQKQLAETYGLSLRVIRDLEQGKLTASIQSVIAVLAALDRKISVS
jgi:DNA-binding XRE family transcriptional regulator